MFLWNIAVTSLAEVWIEILRPERPTDLFTSLPLRKCGLKSEKSSGSVDVELSLPLRKCGLKYRSSEGNEKTIQSLPLRKCGLKLERWRYILL